MKAALVAMIAAAGVAPMIACSEAEPTDVSNPPPASGATAHSGYEPSSGVYYEIHGTGQPLILLHGGVGSIEMFGPVLPQLAQGRRVIAVDLRAHGRTADVDRPLSYEAMADDVAALVAHLGLEKTDIMGYSLGGAVALQTAFRHPHRVRKLVVVSTTFAQDGWYPEVLAAMAQMGPEAAEAMKQTPLYEHYARIAPRPQDWPVLITKLGDLLRTDYDWSREVSALRVPTMIVMADADSVRTAHAVEFYGLLGGGQRDAGWDGSARPVSRLAILPGTTHYDVFTSPALVPAVTPFLESVTVNYGENSALRPPSGMRSTGT
jgi:pimeloyl-ACP methyl ester carboxylesterase